MDSPSISVWGWRRWGVTAFIILWIGVQVLVPLLQKFPPPDFRYRWARYSWAMFSHSGPRYEVRLFRERGGHDAEPIPGMETYARGYRSPEPMEKHTTYCTEDEVLDRLSQLVAFIARQRHDGYSYVASVRWIDGQRAGLPEHSELRAQSRE